MAASHRPDTSRASRSRPRHRTYGGAAVALVCIVLAAMAVMKSFAPGERTAVRGVIDGAPRVEHQPMSRRGPEWKVTIPYRYRVGATVYRRPEVRWMEESAAREAAERYAIGRAVDVHHHPTQPWISTLTRQQPARARWMVLAALMSALPIAAALDS